MTTTSGSKPLSVKRHMSGIVVSDKMDKTCVVSVAQVLFHPLYKKRYVRHKKYFAHDPENKYVIGDEVVIIQSRPLSKKKRWIVQDTTSA